MSEVFSRARDAVDRALDGVDAAAWRSLDGSCLFVAGAGGFFGLWVLHALERLHRRGVRIVVLAHSRDPNRLLARHGPLWPPPWPDCRWVAANARQLGTLELDPCPSHILHMAASSNAADYERDRYAEVQSMLAGTLGCIELARRAGAHLHFVSSGAVYGVRRRSQGPCREDEIVCSAPDPADPKQAYGNAKRMGEALLACALEDYCISRPFAFLGPGLPLSSHFAAGNFVADAAAGRPILVKGDGAPLRSYMHPADLAAWLLALLALRPRRETINIGADDPVSIGDLAAEVARSAGGCAPCILGGPAPTDPPAYWPDITRGRTLGLRLTIDRAGAIADTLTYARTAMRRAVGDDVELICG